MLSISHLCIFLLSKTNNRNFCLPEMKTYTIFAAIVVAAIASWSLLTSHCAETDSTDTTNAPAHNVSDTALPHQTHLPTLPADANFCGEPLPLDRSDVREALDREMLTNTFWHTNTLLVLKRAPQYMPTIERILAEYNVPDDFKYLCVIESSLVPTVKSPAGAVGLWQIMEATGKELGMEINTDVDERYHVERSTEAACRFLLKAYAHFGSWTLVAASYNCGRRRVDQSQEKQKQTSFYDILWNDETARYVYRIIALKHIMTQPEAYGFFVSDSDKYAPDEYHMVEVSTPIADWAQWAIDNNTTYKALKRLNPWLRTNSLTNAKGKTYQLKVQN